MAGDAFRFVVVASTAIDAGAAGWALFAPRGAAAIGMRRVLAAVLITGLVFLVKLAALVPAGLRAFGVIHLIYADLVVLVPATGLALLAGARRRRVSTPVRIAALASLVLIPIGIDATWIEPFRLRLETARVAVSPRREGGGVVRVGVLSDLQTARVTDYERAAVARLMAAKPDVILMPGDVFQGTYAEFAANREALRDLLGRLDAPGGVYLVLGDVDGVGERLEEVLPSTRVRLLVDAVARVEVGDRRLTIAGLALDETSREPRETCGRLETEPGEGDIRILLAHRLDVALGLEPDSRIDLVVAGHTHGGQVVVPGFGPPMTLSRVPRAVAAGGLHRLGGNRIYVSRGVGCERGQAPRIRFFCPPEISLLELGAGREK